MLIRYIPGGALFSGIDIFGFQAIIDFGGKALDAVFKFKDKAGKAFNVAGDQMTDAYDKLMQGGSLIDFAANETAALAIVSVEVLKDCGELGLAVLQAGASVAIGVIFHGIELLQICLTGLATGCSALATYITSSIASCGPGKTITQCIQENVNSVVFGAIFGAFAQGFVSALQGLGIALDWLGTFAKNVLAGLKKFSCNFLSC
jgi:hypothetical protein